MNHLTGLPYGLGATGDDGAAGPTGPQGVAGFTNPLMGNLLAGGFKIRDLADPVAGQDAVTLDYYESNFPSSSGGSTTTKVRFDASVDHDTTVAGLWQDAYIRIGWSKGNTPSSSTGTPEFLMRVAPNLGGLAVFSERTNSNTDDFVYLTNERVDMQTVYQDEVVRFNIYAPTDAAYPSYRGTIWHMKGNDVGQPNQLSQLEIEQY
jgi:hypothetical protein